MLQIPLAVLHVLRFTGLGISFLHFASLVSMVRSIRAEGGGTSEILLSISTGSIGLLAAIMLVLISLLLEAAPVETKDGRRIRRLPMFYVKTRPLIMLIAFAYLAIIPSQIIANRDLRNEGLKKLDLLIGKQRELINRMASLNIKPGGVEPANKLLDQYQIAYNVSLPQRPTTSAQLDTVLEKLSRQLEFDKIRRIRSADSHLKAKTMIVYASSVVTALLLLFYWLVWPH